MMFEQLLRRELGQHDRTDSEGARKEQLNIIGPPPGLPMPAESVQADNSWEEKRIQDAIQEWRAEELQFQNSCAAAGSTAEAQVIPEPGSELQGCDQEMEMAIQSALEVFRRAGPGEQVFVTEDSNLHSAKQVWDDVVMRDREKEGTVRQEPGETRTHLRRMELMSSPLSRPSFHSLLLLLQAPQ